MLPYGRQDISDDDIAAVVATLKSDYLTTGPAVRAFEDRLATRVGAAHAVAMSNATAALHAAVAALGLERGGLLWTSPISFVASANCARYQGADVDFVDIDPETFNMSPAALEAKLAQAKKAGRLPQIIIPVHMGGQSAPMAEIGALARDYGVRVVEDASHAIGGGYQDAPVGTCAHSDIAVFSFHPVKIITTGEGGAAVTQDPELAQKMQVFRSHCVTRDPALMDGASHGPWYYQQVGLGWNYRITDLQAALGLSQMDRLDDFVSTRNARAARYDALLADFDIDVPVIQPDAYSSFHLYIVRLKTADAARRRRVFEAMQAAGIGVNVHYIPIHLQPYYRDLGFAPGDFPVSEDYYDRAITLPLFPKMTDADQDRVVEALASALTQ